MPVEFPSQEKLQEWLDYWQPRLRLKDWDIAIKYVKSKELSDQNHCAECWNNQDHRTATIKISQDYEYEEIGVIGIDFEETVVHELLHCHTNSFIHGCDLSKEGDLLYEQMICALARSFIQLRRELECQSELR